MAVTVQDVCGWMEEWAAPSLAESWDNPGLLVGHRTKEVKRILTALDATEAVIREAESQHCDMIVTHHPMIFRPMSRIEDGDRQGRRVLQLAETGIALYSAHTNLDAAIGGPNEVLAYRIGLQDCHPVPDPTGESMLRVGYVPEPMSLIKLAKRVKQGLGLETVRMAAADSRKQVQKVALCTGAGSEYISLAIEQKADVYITGDVSYHRAEEAVAQGLDILDAGHFGTEVWIAEAIAQYLNGCSDEIQALSSKVMKDIFTTL